MYFVKSIGNDGHRRSPSKDLDRPDERLGIGVDGRSSVEANRATNGIRAAREP